MLDLDLEENLIEDKNGDLFCKLLRNLKEAIQLKLNIESNKLADAGCNSIGKGISAMKRLENL